MTDTKLDLLCTEERPCTPCFTDIGECTDPNSNWQAFVISDELRQEAGKWLSELARAHVYLDVGKPFFSGRDCSELDGVIMALLLAKPAPTPPTFDRDTAEAWMLRAQVSLEKGEPGAARIEIENALQFLNVALPNKE